MIIASLLMLEFCTCAVRNLVQSFAIKQKPAISVIRLIYLYKTPHKYNYSYYLNQTRCYQEGTHNPSHWFRCLFPDLYLIYMATSSIFRCFMEDQRVPIVYTCLFIYIYRYIQMYINAYRYNLHGFWRHYCLSVS